MSQDAHVLDHDTLELLRGRHSAWRLLRAEYAPLIIGFLHRAFVVPNARSIAQPELTSRLDDYLFELRERVGEGVYPRSATEYLDAWASDDTGFFEHRDVLTDTHGFAMLDRLRALLPHTRSFLMDEETLLSHRPQWGREDQQHHGPLPCLAPAERRVYDALLSGAWAPSLRLEQERIGFSWVRRALAEAVQRD